MTTQAAWQEPCRDECCDREDLHPAHAAIPLRGRTPKACPRCLASLAGMSGHCASCGWSRSEAAEGAEDEASESKAKKRAESATLPAGTPWVPCPACCSGHKKSCSWCCDTGFVPRVRAAKMRQR